jgi:competence protein ComFC
MEFADIKNHAFKTRDFILDLIFPKVCLGCDREGAWLCDVCFAKLKFSSGQYCLGCKTPNKSGVFCSKCQQHYYLDGVMIAGNYDDKLLNQLIKALKYHFVKDIAAILGNYLVNFLQPEKDDKKFLKSKFINLPAQAGLKLTIIIPVPLHNRRQRWRGFNQAEAIAKVVAQNFNLEINSQNLIRIKHRQAQSKLNEQQRLSNVANCFSWRGKNLARTDIVLVDDVITTGATLNECAKVLKQNGAGQVWGLVVAKG